MKLARAGRVLRILLVPVIVGVLYLLRANVWFRLYPAIMVAIAFSAFVLSLFKTPLVEQIARKSGERLDARGIAYCRRVTQVWATFLFLNLIVTIATVFASHEVWALYNGCLSYALMGCLFLGEWIYRRKMRHE